jgi:hypothetical protein
MGVLETIRERARQDLVLRTADGLEDVCVWEHTLRVLRTAEQIVRLEGPSSLRIDPLVLGAAALYHDAGWVAQFADGELDRQAILKGVTSTPQRELGAAFLERSLAGLLPERARESASACIKEMSNRKTTSPEAQVLTEAENLDEFGALAFWQMIRQHVQGAKGLDDVLRTWETWKNYGYWDARLKNFRFPSVRRIAQERLGVFDEMVDRLRVHHRGEDILETVAAAGHKS